MAQTLQHSNTMANTNVHEPNYHTDKTQAYRYTYIHIDKNL